MVEHAPGESAMRAADLQGKMALLPAGPVDRLHRVTPRRSSFSRPAAIDRVIGSRDLRRRVRTEKDEERGDLIRGHKLLGWLRQQNHVMDDLFARQVARGHRVWDLLFDEWRPNVTRRDAIDRHSESREFKRRGFGEASKAMLRGHIGGFKW